MMMYWQNNICQMELDMIEMSIGNKYLMEGPMLRKFEDMLAETLGVSYVIGTPSGTSALTLALMAIGICPGDEVLVPDLTFIATASAAKILGATVITVDSLPEITLVDLNRIKKYITDKTKAVITVDFNGRFSCAKELKEYCSNHGIWVIDDACQAFYSGNKNELAGTHADIGCYSFGITKTVTTIKGGCVVTNNEELYRKMKLIKTHGMESVFDGDIYNMPGYNFKLPDVLASIGLAQLNKLKEKAEHLKQIDETYREGLKNIKEISFFRKREDELIWMTDIICENRDSLRMWLNKNGIPTRPMNVPLHEAPYIKSVGNYDNSKRFKEKVMYLPGGPDQPIENVHRVIELINKFYDN